MTTKEKLEKIFGEIKESEWVEYAKVNRLIDELAKERERYDELKAKYDALVMDNMTLEYNAAEAEKHLPDLIKQFVDQERERTAKMVSDLDKLAETYKAEGLYLSWAAIKQITGSYKNNLPPETTGNQTAC